MQILCIDPGTTHSGAVRMRGKEIIEANSAVDNNYLVSFLEQDREDSDIMLIEMIANYGMAVGSDTFETCVWIGRFMQAFHRKTEYVYRKDVKLTLCGSLKAKDANIRQAIIDRYPAIGGGKTPQIGTKAQPGQLYGISSHSWSALALGLTWLEKQNGVGNNGIKIAELFSGLPNYRPGV